MTNNLGKNLAALSGIFVVLTLAIVSAAVFATAARADQTILPGVSVAGVSLGGLTRAQAAVVLRRKTDELLARGLSFTVDGERAVVLPLTLSPNDPDLNQERIRFDHDAATRAALAVGHAGSVFERALALVRLRFSNGRDLPLILTINDDALAADIHHAFSEIELPPREPSFIVNKLNGGYEFTVIPGERGRVLNTAWALTTLRYNLARGAQATVQVPLVIKEPTIPETEAARLLADTSRAMSALGAATTTIIHDGRSWPISKEAVAGLLAPSLREGRVELGFDDKRLDPFFDDIAPSVEVEARDAKFRVENGRVVEFQAHREGVAIDRAATRAALEAAWIRGPGGEVAIALYTAAPKVAIGDINDLGIKEVLGVGFSNFRNSPPTRIKNIQNGINKLNGRLIAPDEEFSLLAALKPFTIEAGYLPEKVIKGDRANVKEIGGGLCQVGSTTFRMAMNSGMNITARRNHSLVVSYYNDPGNGNPGTDATIYDPAPDFRFLNDTGRYLLITTDMDLAKKELRFTLWGSNDGRKGWYDPPVVHKWYRPGEEKLIPTANLKPGERECQPAYTGADASFTYHRVKPDGTPEDKLYTSHYRALPRTCLVGTAPEDLPAPGATSGTAPLTPAEAVDAAG